MYFHSGQRKKDGCAYWRIFRAIAPSTSALRVQLRAASIKLAVLASVSLVVPVALSRKQTRPLGAEEGKERVARIRATSAPSLPLVVQSRKQARFPQIFFSGVETPLKQNPSEAFFHLVKGLGGVLSEKAGLNSRGKKLGEGRAEQRR